eukprot:CFRG7488T1
MDFPNHKVTLVVKTTDGSCADLTLNCLLDMKVQEVMSFISSQHPYKPTGSQQRLIYLGKQLEISTRLRDSLREPTEEKVQTIHLLIKDSPVSRENARKAMAAHQKTETSFGRCENPKTPPPEKYQSAYTSTSKGQSQSVNQIKGSAIPTVSSSPRTMQAIEAENTLLRERLKEMESRINTETSREAFVSPISSTDNENKRVNKLWEVYYNYVLQHYNHYAQCTQNTQAYARSYTQAVPPVPVSWPEYHQHMHNATQSFDVESLSSGIPMPYVRAPIETPRQAPAQVQPRPEHEIPDEYDDREEDVEGVDNVDVNRSFTGQATIVLKLCLLMYVFGQNASSRKLVMLAIGSFVIFLYQTGRLDIVMMFFHTPSAPVVVPAETVATAQETQTGERPPDVIDNNSTEEKKNEASSSQSSKAESSQSTQTQATEKTSTQMAANLHLNVSAGQAQPEEGEGETAGVIRPSLFQEVEEFVLNFVKSLLPNAQAGPNALQPQDDNEPVGNIFG